MYGNERTLSDLVGKTIIEIKGDQGSDELQFLTDDGYLSVNDSAAAYELRMFVTEKK